jgi:predicted nucleotidyltransferase
LRQRLAGIYLIGSLAHGGYSARYSDIDMALVTEDPLAAGEIDLVNEKAALHSAAFAERLSLFWADENFSAGRFPPLDRIDYLDHGVPLLERRRAMPVRPVLPEVQSYLGAEPLQNWSRQAMRFSSLEELTAEDHKGYLRTLLYPARFLYSWETGKVASNDDAVAYVERRNLIGSDIDIVVRTLRCRNDGTDPALLFLERQKLRRLLSICNERVGEAR